MLAPAIAILALHPDADSKQSASVNGRLSGLEGLAKRLQQIWCGPNAPSKEETAAAVFERGFRRYAELALNSLGLSALNVLGSSPPFDMSLLIAHSAWSYATESDLLSHVFANPFAVEALQDSSPAPPAARLTMYHSALSSFLTIPALSSLVLEYVFHVPSGEAAVMHKRLISHMSPLSPLPTNPGSVSTTPSALVDAERDCVSFLIRPHPSATIWHQMNGKHLTLCRDGRAWLFDFSSLKAVRQRLLTGVYELVNASAGSALISSWIRGTRGFTGSDVPRLLSQVERADRAWLRLRLRCLHHAISSHEWLAPVEGSPQSAAVHRGWAHANYVGLVQTTEVDRTLYSPDDMHLRPLNARQPAEHELWLSVPLPSERADSLWARLCDGRVAIPPLPHRTDKPEQDEQHDQSSTALLSTSELKAWPGKQFVCFVLSIVF